MKHNEEKNLNLNYKWSNVSDLSYSNDKNKENSKLSDNKLNTSILEIANKLKLDTSKYLLESYDNTESLYESESIIKNNSNKTYDNNNILEESYYNLSNSDNLLDSNNKILNSFKKQLDNSNNLSVSTDINILSNNSESIIDYQNKTDKLKNNFFNSQESNSKSNDSIYIYNSSLESSCSTIYDKKEIIKLSKNYPNFINQYDLLGGFYRLLNATALRIFKISNGIKGGQPVCELVYTWENFNNFFQQIYKTIIFLINQNLLDLVNKEDWDKLRYIISLKDNEIREYIFNTQQVNWRDNEGNPNDIPINSKYKLWGEFEEQWAPSIRCIKKKNINNENNKNKVDYNNLLKCQIECVSKSRKIDGKCAEKNKPRDTSPNCTQIDFPIKRLSSCFIRWPGKMVDKKPLIWGSPDLYDINEEWVKKAQDGDENPLIEIKNNALNLLIPNKLKKPSYQNSTIFQQKYSTWNDSSLKFPRCTEEWKNEVGKVRTGYIDINWFYLELIPALLKACCLFKVPDNDKDLDKWWSELSEQVEELNKNTPPEQVLPNGEVIKPNQKKFNYLEDLLKEWSGIEKRLNELKTKIDIVNNHQFNKKYKHLIPNTLEIKQNIFRGFKLIQDYYFGFNKQRERTTQCYFGDLSSTTKNLSGSGYTFNGDLSSYIGWIDIYLNRTYMIQDGMPSYNICNKSDFNQPKYTSLKDGYLTKDPITVYRGAFPYFLGFYTWGVLHGLVNSGKHMNKKKQNILINIFKNMLKTFIPTYACSECITHLNNYVITNGTLQYNQVHLDGVQPVIRFLPPLFDRKNPSQDGDINNSSNLKCNKQFVCGCLNTPLNHTTSNIIPNKIYKNDKTFKNNVKLSYTIDIIPTRNNQNIISLFPNIQYEIQWYPVEWICIAPFFISTIPPSSIISLTKSQKRIQIFLYKHTGLWFINENKKWRLDFSTTPNDKLSYITDYKRLRLFIWKLHNTVNSSIWRKEFWYHFKSEPRGLPTRWFPNPKSEAFVSKNFGDDQLSPERIIQLTNLTETECSLENQKQSLLNLYIDGLDLNKYFDRFGKAKDKLKNSLLKKILPIKVLNNKLRENINYLDNYFLEYDIDSIYNFDSDGEPWNPSPEYFQINGNIIRSCTGNFIASGWSN